MATVQSLADRVRAELGDTGRSFVESFTGDGINNRFTLTQSPVLGATLLIKVDGVDVSSTTTIEEGVGYLTLAAVPDSGAVVTVSGTAFRYFTDSEIFYYVNTAFGQHGRTSTDSNGSLVNLGTLPAIEEYPVVILATSMGLYTLATDAAFDIDIISPDGVSIPRSERYRQVNELAMAKREQYRELCNLLGIGMYRVEVYSLRRISRLTNRYVPIYRPQEVDDGSIPQRVYLSMPTYGDVTPATAATSRDLNPYAGDDFFEKVKFSFDITDFTPLGQIRLYPDIPGSQVGPVILASFEFEKQASILGGVVDTLVVKLSHSVTIDLPNVSYYDLQMTSPNGDVRTYLYGKVFTHYQVSE